MLITLILTLYIKYMYQIITLNYIHNYYTPIKNFKRIFFKRSAFFSTKWRLCRQEREINNGSLISIHRKKCKQNIFILWVFLFSFRKSLKFSLSCFPVALAENKQMEVFIQLINYGKNKTNLTVSFLSISGFTNFLKTLKIPF